MSKLIDGIAESIAHMEGYYKPDTLAALNNNPGNLRIWGNLPTRKGYVVFPRAEDGWRALKLQVQRNIERGLTLREFFGGKPGVYSGYAPSADGNRPKEYAEFVGNRIGLSIDRVLREAEQEADG